MSGLLSVELKQKLGIENEGEVLAMPKKKRKGEGGRKNGQKKKLSKKELKKKQSADRLKQSDVQTTEHKELFARISAVSLVGGSNLISSRSLARKTKPVKQPRVIEAYGNVGEEEEDDEGCKRSPKKFFNFLTQGPLIVIRKRARVVAPLVVQVEADRPKKTTKQVAVASASIPVSKRQDPPRTARVFMNRPVALRELRAELPATTSEDEVMAAVAAHDVVVVCGPTGSGKTTQVPQWLVEHGYRNVCVTQPRRVAARMVSERVATEMGVVFGEQVAYKVRQESNLRVASCECDVLFVTDGLLLTVLSGDDVLAEQFGAIVIDEAHERTLGTDVLLGMLSRVIKLRRTRYESGESETPPLKLVIMSATLALEQLMGPHLFCPSPPVVSIEGRQFPVETHWLRVTPDDLSSALEAAVKTVATVHNTLPRGTVLVFLPGKREIVAMTRDLRERFAEDEMVIVPLHSGMEPAQQQLAFKEPPDNARLVILATNIAECSLTLPNIRYVVDPGYAREQVWGDDAGGGVFATRRISQASAMQRTGRAGRTMGGHCYRLYSQPLFHHHMDKHDVPQSVRLPPDALVLTLVGMSITAPERFPLPTPPSRAALRDAQLRLTRLGLLRSERSPLSLTLLGAEAVRLPVEPPAARLLMSLDKRDPALARLAAACCAVWNTGHALWTGQQEHKSLFVPPRAWQTALSAADIFFPMCLLQMMRSSGSAVAAALLRKQYGLSATASEACMGLTRQILAKWSPDVQLTDEIEAPKPQQMLLIQQAMLGALSHNLCRREQSHYVRLLDNEVVYLHPQTCSAAFRDSKHPWISCVDFHSPGETVSKKRYAVYPFAANPGWLEHVACASPDMLAAPLVDYSRVNVGSAQYDAARDCVVCECSPRFGPLVAALPSQPVVLRDRPDLFAVLLLEGRIFPSLLSLAQHLVMPPRSLLGPLRIASQTEFVALLKCVCSKSAFQLDEQLVTAACRLYTPAVRDTAKKVWSKLK